MSQVGSKSMASNILATSGSPCTPCSRQVELDGMVHGILGHQTTLVGSQVVNLKQWFNID